VKISSLTVFVEAVGWRATNLGAAMAVLIDGQVELEGMVQFAAAELAAVFGEQVLGRQVMLEVDSTPTAAMGTVE